MIASVDAAYNEAIEASAMRLMIASRDSSSSGYSSDGETSEGQETESCSIADDPSSVSSSSSSVSSDGGIEGEISFLHEKQKLLKRAISVMKREEIYDASKARTTASGNIPRGSSLWAEAKEVLDILNRREGMESVPIEKKRIATDKLRTPKRPRIDFSAVVCLTSKKIGEVVNISPASVKRAAPPTPFSCTGPWMALALARCIPSSAPPHDSTSSTTSRWEVIHDPDLGPLVVPPTKLPFQNGIRLMDALSFTSDSQLITLSTPPFCVVHANKAFSIFSGLSTGDLIGKPVESILRVVQQETPNTLSVSLPKPVPLKSELLSSKKSCEMLVTPITDRFRSPQGAMSHLLVKIAPGEGHRARDDDMMPQAIQKGLDIRGNHHIFGTVG